MNWSRLALLSLLSSLNLSLLNSAWADSTSTTIFRSVSLNTSVTLSPIVQVDPDLYRAPAAPATGRILQLAANGTNQDVAAGQCEDSGGGFSAPDAPLDLSGAAIALPANLALLPQQELSLSSGVFLEIIDADQNVNPSAVETVEVVLTTLDGAESYTLILSETGLDTGVFNTGVQPQLGTATPGDCQLHLAPNQILRLSYTDPDDNTDQVQVEALVEPTPADIFLSKFANKNLVHHGDLVRFSFTAENRPTAGPALATELVDQLPEGFRVLTETVEIDGSTASANLEPASKDLVQLVIDIEDAWPAGEQREITYLARVTASAVRDTHTLTAIIQYPNGQALSNEASVQLSVQDLFTTAATLIGEVKDEHGQGVGGIRLILDDGQSVTTDEQGRFHFSGLVAGPRAVAIDHRLFGQEYFLVGPSQQTVQLAKGQLKRLQFQLRHNPDFQQVELTSVKHPAMNMKTYVEALADGNLHQKYRICIGKDALESVEVLFHPPKGMTYVANSVKLNHQPVIEPQLLEDGGYSFYLGRAQAEARIILEYDLEVSDELVQDKMVDKAFVETELVPLLSDAMNIRYSSKVDPIAYLVDRDGSESTRTINGQPVWQPDELIVKPTMGILDFYQDAKVHDPVQSIRVRIPELLKPKLYVDDQLVEDDHIGFAMQDPKERVQIYTFVGVDLGEPGRHQLRVEGIGPFGNKRFEHEISLQRIGQLATIDISAPEDQVADGVTPLKLKVMLRDALDQALLGDIRLHLQSDHLTSAEHENQRGRVIRKAHGYLYLNPVEESGLYQGTLSYQGIEQPFEFYVRPAKKEWLLVGFAQGTVGYQLIEDHLDTDAETEGVYWQGQTRLYGQGTIQGDWLMTLAVDSDKPFYGEQAENFNLAQQHFSVFADQSVRNTDPLSTGMLYLRLEKDQVKWLFATDTVAIDQLDLLPYQKLLTAVQYQRHQDDQQVQAFVGQSLNQHHQYRAQASGLSRAIVLNAAGVKHYSETVSVEILHRQTGDVINTRKLSRGVDYQLNYQTGELVLRTTLTPTDLSLNPQYLVVDYESGNEQDTATVAGIHFQRALNDQVTVNSLVLVDETESEEHAGAVGIEVNTGNDWQLGAEIAAEGDGAQGAQLSASKESDDWQYQGDLSFKSDDFGLQTEESIETTKLSQSGRYNLNDQQALLAESQLTLEDPGEALLQQRHQLLWQQQKQHQLVTLGAKVAVTESLNPSNEVSPDQGNFAVVGWQNQLNESGTLLQLKGEGNLSGSSENHPHLANATVTQPLGDGLSLTFANELADSGEQVTIHNRLGLSAEPWQGAQFKNETIRSVVNGETQQLNNTAGSQLFKIGDAFRLDVGFENQQAFQGDNSNDYLLLFTGLTYEQPQSLSQTRFEYRDDALARLYTFAASLDRQPEQHLATSVALESTLQRSQIDSEDYLSHQHQLDGQLALHDPGSSVAQLHRLALDYQESGEQDFANYGVTYENQLAWQINANQQLSSQAGIRLQQNIDQGIEHQTRLYLLGLQHQTQWNAHWDTGLQLSLLADDLGDQQWSVGPVVGYRPNQEVWLGMGYNYQGFTTTGLLSGQGKRQGIYLTIRADITVPSAQALFNKINF